MMRVMVRLDHQHADTACDLMLNASGRADVNEIQEKYSFHNIQHWFSCELKWQPPWFIAARNNSLSDLIQMCRWSRECPVLKLHLITPEMWRSGALWRSKSLHLHVNIWLYWKNSWKATWSQWHSNLFSSKPDPHDLAKREGRPPERVLIYIITYKYFHCRVWINRGVLLPMPSIFQSAWPRTPGGASHSWQVLAHGMMGPVPEVDSIICMLRVTVCAPSLPLPAGRGARCRIRAYLASTPLTNLTSSFDRSSHMTLTRLIQGLGH